MSDVADMTVHQNLTPKSPSLDSLKRFFGKWTRIAFADVDLRDEGIQSYVSDLLTRFARTDSLYRIKNLRGNPLYTVVEMLLEAEHFAHPSEPLFNPFHEREIRKHAADYTLFMTGIFREYVERLGVMDYYMKEGERSYYQVYEFDSVLAKPESYLFRELFQHFENISGALDYLKKVYFRPEMHRGEYQSLVEQLSNW